MKSIRLIITALVISSLTSCSLLGSALKLPGSVLQTLGRTAGVSGLTDEAAAPIEEPPEEFAPIEIPDSRTTLHSPTHAMRKSSSPPPSN